MLGLTLGSGAVIINYTLAVGFLGFVTRLHIYGCSDGTLVTPALSLAPGVGSSYQKNRVTSLVPDIDLWAIYLICLPQLVC